MERNIDFNEMHKFSFFADQWWNPKGQLKSLHKINTLRLQYMKKYIHLKNKRIIDIGCGGGIMSESMAIEGAKVMGIDTSEELIHIAKKHAKNNQLDIDYKNCSIEEISEKYSNTFDTIFCLELLEHVPYPDRLIKNCAKILKYGGSAFFSTLNRNLKSFLFAIIGAEYFLKLIPKGTHKYEKFIKPSELLQWVRKEYLYPINIQGIGYDILKREYLFISNIDVNYILVCKKY